MTIRPHAEPATAHVRRDTAVRPTLTTDVRCRCASRVHDRRESPVRRGEFGIRRRSLLVATLLGVGLAACTEKPAPPVNTLPVTAVVPRAPVPGDSLCPRDGLWKSCALVDRIVKAGLAFKAADDTLKVPYLTPRGVRFKVGRSASLLAFFYPDTASLSAEWRTLDTLRLTPKGDTIGAWPSLPEVVRSENMVVAVFSTDAQQRERVRLAIQAGAPHPASGLPQPGAARSAVPQTLPPAVVRQ